MQSTEGARKLPGMTSPVASRQSDVCHSHRPYYTKQYPMKCTENLLRVLETPETRSFKFPVNASLFSKSKPPPQPPFHITRPPLHPVHISPHIPFKAIKPTTSSCSPSPLSSAPFPTPSCLISPPRKRPGIIIRPPGLIRYNPTGRMTGLNSLTPWTTAVIDVIMIIFATGVASYHSVAIAITTITTSTSSTPARGCVWPVLVTVGAVMTIGHRADMAAVVPPSGVVVVMKDWGGHIVHSAEDAIGKGVSVPMGWISL